MHTHCIVFNATFDAVENRWKALENYEPLRVRKFAENIYYHEFARDLKVFGYRIRNRSRGDFEIEGVSEEICRRFSKRDAEIDAALAKLLANHPELGGANIAELRAKLATEKRTRKQKGPLLEIEWGVLGDWEAEIDEGPWGNLLRNATQRRQGGGPPWAGRWGRRRVREAAAARTGLQIWGRVPVSTFSRRDASSLDP